MNIDVLLAATTSRPSSAPGLALAVLLSLGACGGGDDGDASPQGAADPETGESGAGPLGDPGVSGLAGTGTGTGTGTGAADDGSGAPGDGAAGAGADDGAPAEGPAGGGDGAPADDAMGTAGDPAGDDGSGGVSDPAAPARPRSTELMLEVTVENPMVPPYFNVYRPSDMEAAIETTGGPLPVVVWASGGCFRADFAWAALLERWAAGGYVVLGLTPGPDASVPGTTTAVEHGQLIDWAVEQTDFPEMLDLDRIVASGNSCGGVTALEMTSMDDRVASVFVLSGSSAIGAANEAVMAGVQVPLGFVVGSPGVDIAAGPARMDYDLLGDGIAGMLVNHATGDHFVVSTDASVLPEVAEIALNWMDLTLYRLPGAAAELASADVCAKCSANTWSLTRKGWDSLLP